MCITYYSQCEIKCRIYTKIIYQDKYYRYRRNSQIFNIRDKLMEASMESSSINIVYSLLISSTSWSTLYIRHTRSSICRNDLRIIQSIKTLIIAISYILLFTSVILCQQSSNIFESCIGFGDILHCHVCRSPAIMILELYS